MRGSPEAALISARCPTTMIHERESSASSDRRRAGSAGDDDSGRPRFVVENGAVLALDRPIYVAHSQSALCIAARSRALRVASPVRAHSVLLITLTGSCPSPHFALMFERIVLAWMARRSRRERSPWRAASPAAIGQASVGRLDRRRARPRRDECRSRRVRSTPCTALLELVVTAHERANILVTDATNPSSGRDRGLMSDPFVLVQELGC